MRATEAQQEFAVSGYVSDRKARKPMGPDAKHYPNKAERRALTKICKAAGISAEEALMVKATRQALAVAQKAIRKNPDRAALEKKRALRSIAIGLGLPVYHAEVLAKYKAQMHPGWCWN